MDLSLLIVILVILPFEFSTGNPIYSYRFEVYPVERCPMNSSDFATAANRRNCTKDTRYLCAPDKYLSNLIEFCTDVKKHLYGDGNCVRLEGTGDLNHYNCLERFTMGCPTSPYTDDSIYLYPACLNINKDLKCFVAEKDCPERISPTATSSTERYFNETKKEGSKNKNANEFKKAAALIVIVTSVVLCGVLITGILFNKKRREKKDVQLDEKKLREFLSKGDLIVRQVRCIVIGCTGAGKTTFLQRLHNVSYKELTKIKSTEMVDVHVNSFEVLEDKETIKGVVRENELPTIMFSTDMLETNNSRMHKEQTPDNKKYYMEDGDSKEDEQSIRSENEAILENKDSSSDNCPDKTIRSRRKQNVSTSAMKKQELSETSEEEGVESNHYEVTRESIRLIPFSKGEKVLSEGNEKYIGRSGRIETESKDNINAKYLTSTETSDVNTTEKHHDRTNKDIETKSDCDDHDDTEKYALLKIKDAVKNLSSESDLHPRITFLDFAGHSVNYIFHQIFSSPKAFHILVVDMSKQFEEQVHFHYSEKKCSRYESWTYQDYYKFWLSSIDSVCDTKTPVIVVGTHAENLSRQDTSCNTGNVRSVIESCGNIFKLSSPRPTMPGLSAMG